MSMTILIAGPHAEAIAAPAAHLTLFAADHCRFAQRARIAQAARGLPLITYGTAGRSNLQITGCHGAHPRCHHGSAMLAVLAALHPDQPLEPDDPGARTHEAGLQRLAELAEVALERAARARSQGRYDLDVFRLRGVLHRLETGLAARMPAPGLTHLDAMAAPLLWRLAVFDGRCESHFLTGLAGLRGWAEALLHHPATACLHTPWLAERFLARQRRLGGLLTTPHRDHIWHALAAPALPARGMA